MKTVKRIAARTSLTRSQDGVLHRGHDPIEVATLACPHSLFCQEPLSNADRSLARFALMSHLPVSISTAMRSPARSATGTFAKYTVSVTSSHNQGLTNADGTHTRERT